MRRIWGFVPLMRVGMDCTAELLGIPFVDTRETDSTAGGGDGSVAGGGGIDAIDERRGGGETAGIGRIALGVLIDVMVGARGGGGIFGAIIDWRGGIGDAWPAGRTRGRGGVLGSGRDEGGRGGAACGLGALARGGGTGLPVRAGVRS